MPPPQFADFVLRWQRLHPETQRGAAFDHALVDLRRAVAAGFRNVEQVRSASDFEPLRARRDFQAILLDMVFPVDPFRHPG